MTSLKLDNNNNLEFSSNLLIVSDDEALKQDIKTLLLMFNGEYPFDITQGIKWQEEFIESDKKSIKDAITARVLEDKRVLSANVEIESYNNSQLQIKIEITKKDGSVINV